MSTCTSDVSSAPRRRPFQGVAQIVAFNWPRYLAGVVVVAAAGAVGTALSGTSRVGLEVVGGLGWMVMVGAVWWMLASLGVSHWVYDRAGVYELRWMRDKLPGPRRTWVMVHAGLDEFSSALQSRMGSSPVAVLDIYDPRMMTEPSIARARSRRARADAEIAARHDDLTVSDRSCDAVFILLAAHELRETAARAALFAEVRRILNEDGRAFVLEHLRDWRNVAVFGPGAWHFHSRRTWLQSFAAGGLAVDAEAGVTPFVRLFVLRRAE